MNPPLRIVFMGTAPLAVPSLRAVCAEPGFHVAAVVTQPDKPKGRNLQVQGSAVKRAALEAGLPILQPNRAREGSFVDSLRALAPDLIVVAAYGQILPQVILDLPRYGCLNVHASLLPRYRGAAPIQWAILDGQPETGVTIMKMDAGLDTGPMLTTSASPIHPDDTSATLHDRLAELGARLLVETIPGYVSGLVVPRPQPNDGATYARKITKEDGLICWSAPARQIWNQVRGLNPWPGAHTHLEAGGTTQLIKIWRAEVDPVGSGKAGTVLSPVNAPTTHGTSPDRGLVVACGEQSLRILELQREGRRRVSAAEFLSGCPLPAGTVLGSKPAAGA